MPTGTVKWFNNTKGYGFIESEAFPGDVFIHYSAITMEGYKTLRPGQQVQFDPGDSPKGLCALNVRLIAEDHPSEPDISQSDDPPQL